MPPPTMTTSTGCGMDHSTRSAPAPERLTRSWSSATKGAESFSDSRPAQRDAARVAPPASLHVDVEQDLGVVADEADRDHEHPPHARCRDVRRIVVRQIGTDPRLGCAAGALERDVVAASRPAARPPRSPWSRTWSRYGSPIAITRSGSACAVNTTASSADGPPHSRMRSANACASSGCVVERRARSSKLMPGGIADCAASTYFCTLSVENCGASGMPTTREMPVPQRPQDVGDERVPVPHADHHLHSGPRRSRSAFRCCTRDVGEWRAAADGGVVVRASPR